jgi:hypothetical protein
VLPLCRCPPLCCRRCGCCHLDSAVPVSAIRVSYSHMSCLCPFAGMWQGRGRHRCCRRRCGCGCRHCPPGSALLFTCVHSLSKCCLVAILTAGTLLDHGRHRCCRRRSFCGCRLCPLGRVLPTVTSWCCLLTSGSSTGGMLQGPGRWDAQVCYLFVTNMFFLHLSDLPSATSWCC